MNRSESGNLDSWAAISFKESLEGAVAVDSDGRWFANRGQVLQAVIQALALIIAIRSARRDLMESQFFSWGALLLYALVGSVIVSFMWMVRNVRAISASSRQSEPDQALAEVRRIDEEIRAENLRVEDRCRDLQRQLAAALGELNSLKASAKTEQERREQIERILQNAPRMRIEYSGRTSETLEFINDGPGEVSNPALGPLSLVRKEEHLLHLHEQVPPVIHEQHREAVAMNFKPNPAEPRNSVPLHVWLAELDVNSEVSAAIRYHGPQRVWFSRKFSLRAFPDGKVVWNPGPVEILDEAKPPSTQL